MVGRDATVRKYLQDQVEFHNRWRRRTMIFYAGTTLGALGATTAATVVAAYHGDTVAAGLTSFATLSYGAERALYLREKWRLHVFTSTNLATILTDLELGSCAPEEAAKRATETVSRYAAELPVAPRESHEV